MNAKVPHRAQVLEFHSTLSEPLTLPLILIVVLDVIHELRITITERPILQARRIDDERSIRKHGVDIHQRKGRARIAFSSGGDVLVAQNVF